jgi:hypothetical protein
MIFWPLAALQECNAASGKSSGLSLGISYAEYNDNTTLGLACGPIPLRKHLHPHVWIKKIGKIATLPALCG